MAEVELKKEEGLKKLNQTPSNKFERRFFYVGTQIPNIPLDVFMNKYIDTKNFYVYQDNKKYWEGKNLRDYCLSVAHERKQNSNGNNGNKENKNDEYYEINPDRKKELLKVLKDYAAKKITEFKEKEKHVGEPGITMDKLKEERDEILGFMRAKEDLEDKNTKPLEEAEYEKKKSGAQGAIDTESLLKTKKI